MVLRALVESGRTDMEVVAINDLAQAERLAHLLKYDSVLGNFPETVSANEISMTVNGNEIAVLSERNPKNLPWKGLGIDIVFECTGFFLTQDLCGAYTMAGA